MSEPYCLRCKKCGENSELVFGGNSMGPRTIMRFWKARLFVIAAVAEYKKLIRTLGDLDPEGRIGFGWGVQFSVEGISTPIGWDMAAAWLQRHNQCEVEAYVPKSGAYS